MSAVATKPRLGFLGVGWIGRARLHAVAGAGEAEVVAIADPALDGALDSLDELLDLELDGVVIATPSALHAEQATAALERGIAVFCQKPLARTAAETERVIAAARAADRLLGVDLSYRWTKAAQVVREVVRAGEIGDVYAVELLFHNAYGPDRGWFYDSRLSGGGCVIDLAIHLVDLVLWTLPDTRVVNVAAALRGEPVEQYATAQLQLSNGAAARLACSWNLPLGRDCEIQASFYGSRGGVSFRNVDGSFYNFVAEQYERTARKTLVAPPDDWGGRAIVDWTRRLARGEGFDPACAELAEVARVLDGIYGA